MVTHTQLARWRRYLAPASRIWWAVALAFLLLIGVYFVRLWPKINNMDLAIHVHAAEVLLRGGDIYADAGPWVAALQDGTFNNPETELQWPFIYPPLVAIVLTPLALIPYDLMAAGWTVASVLMLLLAGWLCLRAQGALQPLDYALLGATLYAFYPAVAAVRLGQLEVPLFLLLAGTFYALKRGHDDLAGVLLGLATALKFFPGALIAFLLWKRLWRPAAVAIGITAVLLFGSFSVIGLDQISRYLSFTSVYTRGAFGAFPFNQSLHGFFLRNLTRNLFAPSLKGLHLPLLADALTYGISAALGGLWAWLAWGRADVRRDRFDLEFGGSIALMLLVMPHSQLYGFTYALLPFLVLAYRLCRRGPDWGWIPTLAAYALTGRYWWAAVPGLTRFVAGHIMFGGLLLFCTVAGLLYRSQRHQQTSAPCPIGHSAQ